MTDRAKIQTSWERMKSGNVLTKYKQQNPGEVKQLDAFAAQIAAGENPIEPHLSTLFGSGVADMMAAAIAPDVVVPDPPPTPTPPSGLSAKAALALGFRINGRSSSEQDYEIAKIIDLHAGTVRIDGANTNVIDKLLGKGIKPVIIIGSNPQYPWSTSASAYGASCKSLAQTYAGKVDTWEVMNEPDLNGWTPQTYFPYLKSAYENVKLGNSNAQVWPGGIWKWQMDSGGKLYSTDWYDQLYQLGAKSYMDAINIHAYDDPSEHGSWSAWDMAFGWPGGPYATRNIRSIANANGDSAKPILVTEAGGPVPKYSDAKQAQIVTNALALADGVGTSSWKVKQVYVYCVLADDGAVPPSEQFSLLDQNRNPRPSYAAFKAGAS